MQSGVRGFTTADQVSFFPDKEKKLIEGGKWPQEYEKEVDMSKVNMDVIAKWIQKRLTELLGVEDDIVVDYCKQQLFPVEDASDTSTSKKICPKKLQINLTGFLAKNASIFVKELWSLLLSAQANAGGVPQQFIDDQSIQLHAKQEEVRKVKEVLEQTQGLEVSDHQSPSRDQLSQSRRRSASRSRPRSFKHSTSRSPCRGQRRRSPLHKGRRPIRDISRNRRSYSRSRSPPRRRRSYSRSISPRRRQYSPAHRPYRSPPRRGSLKHPNRPYSPINNYKRWGGGPQGGPNNYRYRNSYRDHRDRGPPRRYSPIKSRRPRTSISPPVRSPERRRIGSSVDLIHEDDSPPRRRRMSRSRPQEEDRRRSLSSVRQGPSPPRKGRKRGSVSQERKRESSEDRIRRKSPEGRRRRSEARKPSVGRGRRRSLSSHEESGGISPRSTVSPERKQPVSVEERTGVLRSPTRKRSRSPAVSTQQRQFADRGRSLSRDRGMKASPRVRSKSRDKPLARRDERRGERKLRDRSVNRKRMESRSPSRRRYSPVRRLPLVPAARRPPRSPSPYQQLETRLSSKETRKQSLSPHRRERSVEKKRGGERKPVRDKSKSPVASAPVQGSSVRTAPLQTKPGTKELNLDSFDRYAGRCYMDHVEGGQQQARVSTNVSKHDLMISRRRDSADHVDRRTASSTNLEHSSKKRHLQTSPEAPPAQRQRFSEQRRSPSRDSATSEKERELKSRAREILKRREEM